MKVLLIHNFYQYWGGEDTYVISLQKLLTKNGHTVILYAKDSKNIKTIWDKIKTGFGLFWNLQVARELDEIIQKEKPDVAHFNNIYPLIGATAYYICKKNKIKIVQTIHNYRFMCPKGILFRDGKICELCVKKQFFSPAIRFGCYHGSQIASFFYSFAFFIHKKMGVFNYIDTYIFPSKFTQQYYERHLHIPKLKSFYLPHFINFKIPIKVKKKGAFDLFVGRLSDEKGIIELLELYKQTPKKKLVVIGTGPLQNQVNNYKLYGNIKILGFVNKKKLLGILCTAKMLLFTSKWYEVSPMIILESKFLKTKVTYTKFYQKIHKNFSNQIKSTQTDIYMKKLIKKYNE